MAYTFKHGDRPIDGIEIQRAVGRGGFGEVYYALTDSGKQVAVKYLRDNVDVELRGVSHVMNLKSPHLITIYDVRRNADGEPFVIMEYVSGPSLRELLNAAGPRGIGVEKAAFFLAGIAKGLSYLHERGVVHRDLKPANIFFDDGYVKIGDYGLSKHMSVSQHSGQTVSVGTVHYMAPEIGSGSYTRAIDIYALGVMFYEMLTGRLPFTGASMGEILLRHVNDRPNLAGVPEPLASVIAKALVKDPNGRYQDVNDMVDAVTRHIDVRDAITSVDAASIAAVPRDAEATDLERTVTRTPLIRPTPTLDAGLIGRSAPPLPALPPLPTPQGIGPDRLGPDRGAARAPSPEPQAPHTAGGTPAPRAALLESMQAPGKAQQFAIFMLLLVGSAVGLTLLLAKTEHVPPPPAAAALMLMLAGSVAGPVAAHLLLLRDNPARGPLLDRVVHGGAALLGLLPGVLIGFEARRGELSALAIPMLLAVVVCDWDAKIVAGRRFNMNGWTAFWPAILGLIGAGAADLDDGFKLAAVGACVAMTLLTQAAAAMWPMVNRPAAPPSPVQLPNDPYPTALVAAAAGGARLSNPPLAAGGAKAPSPVAARGVIGTPAPTIPHSSGPGVSSSSMPERPRGRSLISRGLRLLTNVSAVVLLMLGLFAALSFVTGTAEFSVNRGHTLIAVDKGRILVSEVHDPRGMRLVMPIPGQTRSIPPALPLGLLTSGFGLSLLARRSTPALHQARLVLSGVLMLAATAMVVAPNGLHEYMTRYGGIGDAPDRIQQRAIAAGLMFVVSVVLLGWSQRKAQRKPFVV